MNHHLNGPWAGHTAIQPPVVATPPLPAMTANPGRVMVSPPPPRFEYVGPPLPTPPPFGINLRPFLPDDWRQHVEGAALAAQPVRREGGGPGSLHLGSGAGLDYRTVAGADLEAVLPWVRPAQALVADLLALALGVESARLLPIAEPHGVSLNVLSPESGLAGLEWHRDGGDVAFTVIFSDDTWDDRRGGRFLWHDGRESHAADLATPGVALACATGRLPHAVEPPNDRERRTVMLAFTAPGLAREPELSTYLGQEA